jgi:hypothetical protein
MLGTTTDFLALLLSKCYEEDQINEEELSETCSMYGILVTRIQKFVLNL